MLIFRNKLNWHWWAALGIYHLLVVVVMIVNFPDAGNTFIGWDSLHPEFDFWLNLQRSLFAVWQSNYGVGAMVGHGFAALLPHTLITWAMSVLSPLWAIRPLFILTCYYLGGLGMMMLVKQLVSKVFVKHPNINSWASLIAAIFYIFNLGTVQLFYLPLEAFVVQFALFPWFFWALNRYWTWPKKENLLLFAFINLLGSMQGFIPVLYISFSIAFGIWQLVTLCFLRTREGVKKSLLLILTFLLVNIYWLLPFSYYVVGNSSDFLRSYNNQVTTPEFVAKSGAYGTIEGVAFLKSSYLDSEQPSGKVFAPWIEHITSTQYETNGWILFGLILIGWAYCILFKGGVTGRPYAIAALIVFGFLAIQIPPFSWLLNFLYSHSILFEQVFRSSFTKFGTLLAGFYSLFLAVGIAFILIKIKEYSLKAISILLIALGLGAVTYLGWPVLLGNLFDKQLVQRIPQAYFDVMNTFKSEGEGRVAEFPIDCSEGWYSRDWGYYGSGFMWFGINQPYMSRTFDVWSSSNENFYFEARYALRQSDYEGIDRVMTKYGVRWVYLDRNLDHCQSKNGLAYLEEFDQYLNDNPNYRLVKELSDPGLKKPLKIYEYVLGKNTKVNSPNTYVDVSNSRFTNIDKIYQEFGTYIESPSGDVNYIFSSDDKYTIDHEIVFTNNVDKDGMFHLPAYKETEKIIPVKITLEKVSLTSNYLVKIDFLGASVYLNNSSVLSPPTENIGPITIKNLSDLQIFTDNIPMSRNSDLEFTGMFFVGSENNFIVRHDGVSEVWWNSLEKSEVQSYLENEINLEVSKGDRVEILVPKIFDKKVLGNYFSASTMPLPQDCLTSAEGGLNRYELDRTSNSPRMRLISSDSEYCLRIKFDEALSSEGYIVQLKTKNITGLPIKYRLTNARGISYEENYFDPDNNQDKLSFIAPPVFDNDLNYTFEITNRSFGNLESVNDLYSLEYWHFPYRLISSGYILPVSRHVVSDFPHRGTLSVVNIKQINPLFYKIDVSGQGLLVLSQGYDEGWIAPPIKHVKVDGWANGWIIENSGEVTIFYWPQLLEYLGFVMLGATIWVIYKSK